MTEETTPATTEAQTPASATPTQEVAVAPPGEQLDRQMIREYREFAAQLMMREDLWLGFKERCEDIAKTRLYGHKAPETIMIAGLAGFERGWSLMAALQRIKVIHGTPCILGPAAVAMVRAEGYFIDCVESTPDTATWECERPGYKRRSYTYTRQMAEKAGLPARNDNWNKFPDRCCKWAAATLAVQEMFTEIVAGFAIAEGLQAGIGDLGPVEQEPSEPREPAKDWARAGRILLMQLTEASLKAEGVDFAKGDDRYNDRRSKCWDEACKRAEYSQAAAPSEDDWKRLVQVMQAMIAEIS